MSMNPGASTRPAASIVRLPLSSPPIPAIRPSRIHTSPTNPGAPVPSTIVAPRTTMSMMDSKSEERPDQIDDRLAILADHRNELPLVKRRARVRQVQTHPVADLDPS